MGTRPTSNPTRPPSSALANGRQVLHLLSSADKDEIAAREMGVSLRTYRRYVAELLVRLGATNRFQAVLLARKQGWI
ncbi:hypothetical protein AB0B45_40405 [Nonomuraea sp. NPDC049152]|uniref:hypothetical protein n=1 Tax=Nonomuraea sp. NPDC049152 TaxID=3154350 RepID=UPI0033E9C3DD